MTTNGSEGRILVDQVVTQARYETLRELANQLVGALIARERAAGADAPASWSKERRAIRARVHTIDPGTPAVDQTIDEWAARLRELRRGGA